MFNSSKTRKTLLGSALAIALAAPLAEAKEVLHVYNWSDYIAPETIERFERETGIDVVYDVFDSNEVLEAKLLAGNTGFDLVVPSSYFLAHQIKAGIFQPLDKSKLPNIKYLDPVLMRRLAQIDPDNRYSLPYLWGTSGFGYNVQKVRAVLGDEAPVDSWDLLLKPDNLAKLSSCGVAFLDAPTEALPAALHYLGLNPNSTRKSDYRKGAELLKQLRPHITYFHSSQYINDLANGDICVAFGWSGDVMQAAMRAEEVGNGVEVHYVIPKEGAAMWFDMLAIPADARNVDNAHTFINYLMQPEVTAEITDYVAYSNANPASAEYVDEAIRTDTAVFPTAEVKAKLYPFQPLPNKINRLMTRLWTDIKAGR